MARDDRSTNSQVSLPFIPILGIDHLRLLADKVLTCSPCVVRKRKQHANRLARKQQHIETLKLETKQFTATSSDQSAEITLLQNMLGVLRQVPDMVTDQLLRKLQMQPIDAATSQQLIATYLKPRMTPPSKLSEPVVTHPLAQCVTSRTVPSPVPEPTPSPITAFSRAEPTSVSVPCCQILAPVPCAMLANRFVSQPVTPPSDRTPSSRKDGAKRQKITNYAPSSGTHADVKKRVLSSDEDCKRVEKRLTSDDEIASVLLTLRTECSEPPSITSGAFAPVTKGYRMRIHELKASAFKSVKRPSALRYVPVSASRYFNYKYSSNIQRITEEVQ